MFTSLLFCPKLIQVVCSIHSKLQLTPVCVSMAGVVVNSVALGTYIFSLFWSGLNTQGSRTVPTLMAPLIYLSYTKHCSTHQPPLVPLWSPFSCDPCDLCSVTAQREDPLLRLPWQWPWRASVRHALLHTHTRLHTAARRTIDILLYGGGWGWVGRWELHCSELTAETQGKLERGWVCLSVSDRKWVFVCVGVSARDTAFVIGQ